MIIFAIFQSAKVQNIFGFCKLFCAYFNFLVFFLFVCCKITFIINDRKHFAADSCHIGNYIGVSTKF